ncbi:50S ribosomal protein P1 [Methanonatronarchaeum sp. AMET6-2]|uniref:50S ribosomal protein P1 n=1 Tax=Methanonatronarchaeum sp. AMET6-2 TaxID=2933293 RepID=UPI0011FAD84B|nr:50S ribosomal protein P1 [Methanonatronarchaeum sp. AMET6-2]RZN61129.1 MAG: 50S ribosomal protein P1 [Methanonatronarchaeia archaeon]UOY09813.1 50S ribosomal protein P1 [Methanonatronarchaeum sp. AMET6-2]
MEYIYAAMLVHSAGKEVTEESVSEVLGSAGVEVDDSRVKALVAALEEVDIEEAIESGQMAPAAAAPAAETAEPAEEEPAEEEEAEEEEEKDEEEAEEDAAEGLGALFQ